MTEKKIPCEVIQDLLPLYVDRLTSEATGQEIEKHMKECEACTNRLNLLKTELQSGASEKKQEQDREIDYLKKVKKSGIKKVLLSVTMILALLFLAVGLKLFVIGSPNPRYTLLYTNMYEDYFEISGMVLDSAASVSRYVIKENGDGTTELVVYTCLPSFFHRSGMFQTKIFFDEIGSGINVGGATIKQDGTMISKLANDVYEARNPYVGDVSADGKLVAAIGMTNTCGYATTELQTAEEPYGWTFHFTDSVKSAAVFEEHMKNYACVLIAMTDNLSEVHWTYTVETDDGWVERESGINKEACSAYVGADIKQFSENPEKVQELLDILGF